MSAGENTPRVSGPGAAAPSRRRRWLRRLVIIVVVLALLSLLATWLLQPEQLVPLILDRAGKALGLGITASGEGEVRLRGACFSRMSSCSSAAAALFCR